MHVKYKATEKGVKFKISSPTNPAKIKMQKGRTGLSHLMSCFSVSLQGQTVIVTRERELLKEERSRLDTRFTVRMVRHWESLLRAEDASYPQVFKAKPELPGLLGSR